MVLSIQTPLLTAIYALLTPAVSLYLLAEDTALGGVVTQAQGTQIDKTYSGNMRFPIDIDPRFLVKRLSIHGNTLISTRELLLRMPLFYFEYETDPATGEHKEDPTTGAPIIKDVYDFRVLIEMINKPGSEREVSAETVRGFTKYVLAVYRDKGYRGINIYVPKEALD